MAMERENPFCEAVVSDTMWGVKRSRRAQQAGQPPPDWLQNALRVSAVTGVPVQRLVPDLGSFWHGIRSKPADGELPWVVIEAITWWVRGQSLSWIGRRLSIDRMTVRRWVLKNPDIVRRVLAEEGGVVAAYTPELVARKVKTLRRMGIDVGPVA